MVTRLIASCIHGRVQGGSARALTCSNGSLLLELLLQPGRCLRCGYCQLQSPHVLAALPQHLPSTKPDVSQCANGLKQSMQMLPWHFKLVCA